MASSTGDRVRVAVLAGILGSSLLVLGKAIAQPKTGDAPVNAYQFPSSVALENWDLLSSAPLKSEVNSVLGQQYRYRQKTTSLDVQVRSEVGDGNVSRFLFVHSPIRTANAKLQIRQQPNGSFYGVLTHEGRAYLSACINPRGGSTVTEQQFTQNRYRYDLQVGRLLPWMLGQESLLDRRCLWTLMSVPLPTGNETAIASEDAYKTLEAAWISWNHWWQLNFPPT
ncbi:cyanoexosortase A system-associated protein [Leptolyngbya sp. FACHB-36]|uniref:cyanoexosortase A system-associated protein n=1 Tax=Leptolyngbya sp. FACHB-36 TaxID=2692808 RepID=UPI00168125B9|nr:cyanoexosortase A system-associated protein [Leptolyngbya sp. FACHB-36]MBD2022074.1 cyanoexosortase A system-associated protein [Leptolyngbya sp. FACHB-36]